MSQAIVPFRHPLLRCLDDVAAALDSVADADPAYLSTDAKRELLVGLTREINRLEGHRLSVVAVAGDVAEEDGAWSAGAWLAHETRLDGAAGRRLQRLADAVTHRHPGVGVAIRSGRVDVFRAREIVRSLDDLPHDLSPDIVRRAERRLVQLAGDFEPRRLRVLGRRILEVVAPDVADEHERRLLEREEQYARSRMQITTHDLGHGLSRAVVDLPTATMDLWMNQLQSFIAPRRAHLATGPARIARVDPDTGERAPYPRLLAQAFATMLEQGPSGGLPRQGGDATTLLVTIDHDRLVDGLGAAGLSTGGRISAGEARRLACNSDILPVVLGGKSQPLDLGRARRLFSPAQRKAMAIRDSVCRTDGCDIPAAWCEAHHLRPWSAGGQTDLADGLLLCPFHHHRAHDRRYDMKRHPNGDVRFHRRR
jgi:hypothetical protein